VKVARNVPPTKSIEGLITSVEPLSSSVPLGPRVMEPVAWRLPPEALRLTVLPPLISSVGSARAAPGMFAVPPLPTIVPPAFGGMMRELQFEKSNQLPGP